MAPIEPTPGYIQPYIEPVHESSDIRKLRQFVNFLVNRRGDPDSKVTFQDVRVVATLVNKIAAEEKAKES